MSLCVCANAVCLFYSILTNFSSFVRSTFPLITVDCNLQLFSLKFFYCCNRHSRRHRRLSFELLSSPLREDFIFCSSLDFLAINYIRFGGFRFVFSKKTIEGSSRQRNFWPHKWMTKLYSWSQRTAPVFTWWVSPLPFHELITLKKVLQFILFDRGKLMDVFVFFFRFSKHSQIILKRHQINECKKTVTASALTRSPCRFPYGFLRLLIPLKLAHFLEDNKFLTNNKKKI